MVGVYVRVSTLQQKDNYSVETQRERGVKFAESHGEEYELYDEALSGKNLERPEFLRLLRDVEHGRITKVWVIEFSRLTRDTEDALAIRKIFIKHHAQVYVNDVLMDLSSPEAVLMYNIKSSVSEYERSNTISRVVRSRRKQIDEGQSAFSILFGYDYKFAEDGTKIWMINETEANVVRKIYAWYSEGKSYIWIANTLNDSGFVTKKGKKFAITTITYILNHPEYFGLTKNTKGELIESKIYPPILPRDQFKQIQYQHKNREKKAVQFREATAILAGMITCGKCGAYYYAHKSTQHREKQKADVTFYRYAHKRDTTLQIDCDNKPKSPMQDDINTFVEFCYRAFLRNKNSVAKLVREREKDIVLAEDELEKQIGEMQKKLNKIEESRQRLISGIADNLYTAEDIRPQMTKLNGEKAEAQSVVTRLQESLSEKKGDIEKIITAFADRNIEEYESASDEKKRQIYQSVIKSLTIKDNWVYLTFITEREYSCPINRINLYIKAIQEVGEKEAFSKNTYRWDEISGSEARS